MKRLIALTTLFLLVIFVGCGQASVSGIPVVRHGEGRLTTLDTDAAKLATEVWKPTKAGESHFVWMVLDSETRSPTGEAATERREILIELREPVVSVEPSPLYEADKLNGIDWRGEVHLTAKAFRSRCLKTPYAWEKGKGDWSEWESSAGAASLGAYGSLAMIAAKANGNFEWQMIGGMINGRVHFREAAPSDIPK